VWNRWKLHFYVFKIRTVQLLDWVWLPSCASKEIYIMEREFYMVCPLPSWLSTLWRNLFLPQSNFLDAEVAVIKMSDPCLAPHLIFHTFPLEIWRWSAESLLRQQQQQPDKMAKETNLSGKVNSGLAAADEQ
jgi:hypothetical protein